MSPMTDWLTLNLLGQLELLHGGAPVQLRGARPRALLAFLALHANERVTTEQVIAALWSEPPKAARSSIQYFVHQIRQALGGPDTGKQILLTVPGGYQLHVRPGHTDVQRFQRLVADARHDHARGRRAQAWERFGQALALWRGPALVDFTQEPFVAAATDRLDTLRLAAVETQLQVGLELGRHGELVGELEALTRAHPARPGLHALLMLALYRSGRQAEALEAYRTARRALPRPDANLEELQRAILTHDPSLSHPHPPSPHPADPPGHTSPSPPADDRHRATAPSTPTPPPPPTPTTPPVQPAAQREERKLVTVLTVGLTAPGGSGDPEDARTWQRAVTSRMARRVERYGGTVQVAAAGRMVAVFGAAHSRDDDPERAVRAALDLVRSSGREVAVGAGVATAEVVVTHPPPDPAAAAPPQVSGDAVHAAATLETAARSGAVLVGAGTYQATHRQFSYQPVPPDSASDAPAGTQAWQVRAPRARTGAQVHDRAVSPLTERERELRLLDGVLNRFVRERGPQLLTVLSEPGLGKSRLVDELARLVDQAPELVGWRTGRSLASGGGAFGALAEIVRAHTGILDTDDTAAADRKLRLSTAALVSDHTGAAQVTESLRTLLGGARPEQAPVERDTLFAGWSHFLAAAAASRPLVLVFEDLQWADDGLLEFVDGLPEQAGAVPLLVVCTARPELLERRPGWGGGKPNSATISLSPLSRDGTGALLDVLLGPSPLPDATRAALLTASGGNPLYVEEYVHMLHQQPPGAGGEEQLPIPPSVRQVITARVDTLPAPEKRLLKDAAVIGDVGWVGALAAVTGQDRGQVEAGLRSLHRREFLRQVRHPSIPDETEYVFRHTLIREVAYQQLLRAERADKHQRTARWIHDLNPDPGERADLLAYHYGRALALTRASGLPDHDLSERTRGVFRAAGDRAAALGALTAAARHYERALDLWPDGDATRPELLLRLGAAVFYSQHRGEEILTQARAAALDAGQDEVAAEADMMLSQLARIRTDTAAAVHHTRRWLPDRPGEVTPAALAAHSSHAIQLLIADRHAEAIDAAEAIIDLARQLDLPGHEGNGLTIRGNARIRAGDLGGTDDAERGHALMDAHQFPLRAFARFGYVQALWWYGDLERCAVAVAAGRQVAEGADAAVVAWFGAFQAGLDYCAGRWEPVVAAADQLLARQRTDRERYLVPWLRTLRGRVRLGRGDLDDALDDARAATHAATGDTRYHQVALALHGRALLAAGHRDRAAATLEELLTDQHKHPAASCATPDLAMLLVDLDHPADALPHGLPPVRWHQAVRAFAERDFTRAAERFTAIGSIVDAERARLRLAQQPGQTGDR